MNKARDFLIFTIMACILVYTLFMIAEYNNHKIEMLTFENSEDLFLACEEFYINQNYVNVENCKPYFQKENNIGNYTCGVEICSSEKAKLNNMLTYGNLTLVDDNYTYQQTGYRDIKGKLYNLNVNEKNILIAEYSLYNKRFYVFMVSSVENDILRTKYFSS